MQLQKVSANYRRVVGLAVIEMNYENSSGSWSRIRSEKWTVVGQALEVKATVIATATGMVKRDVSASHSTRADKGR